MGLPLELDVQKEETMRALLVLFVFVLLDAQLAIERRVILACHVSWAYGLGLPPAQERSTTVLMLVASEAHAMEEG